MDTQALTILTLALLWAFSSIGWFVTHSRLEQALGGITRLERKLYYND